MAVIGWMAAFLLFLGLELAQRALTTLWFACGALAAAVAAFGLADIGVQLLWFAAVSFLALVLVRPAALWVARVANVASAAKTARYAKTASAEKTASAGKTARSAKLAGTAGEARAASAEKAARSAKTAQA